MRDDGSLVYRSIKTSYSYSRRHNGDDMKVLNKKVFKCLKDRKVVDIFILRPSTVPQVTGEVVEVMDIGLKRLVTIPQGIVEVMDVGQV